MRSRCVPLLLLALALLPVPASGISLAPQGDPAPPSPEEQQALQSYLQDPAANAKAYLDAIRDESGAVRPLPALFLGDAALRLGRYRMATDVFEAVRDTGDPNFGSLAEIGLAGAALGRGRLPDASEHLAAAGELNPGLRSYTDVAVALVDAASGTPGGREELAAAALRPDVDPQFREIAPLLDAYSRYWAGDAASAADAFTAFAVAHPDSRFADDALYAAAQAKQRAGRDAEAQADLEALAGDRRSFGPVSSRLVALDGRSLLREGMRRDRGMTIRNLAQRIADLLDGDGSRMARAALAARAREAAVTADDTDAGAPDARGAARETGAAPTDEPGPLSSGAGTGRARERPVDGGNATPAGPAERPTRFPWVTVLTIAALLAALGLWLLARVRPAQMRSR
jgi:tetratricopeptide (TPR) repeat protein